VDLRERQRTKVVAGPAEQPVFLGATGVRLRSSKGEFHRYGILFGGVTLKVPAGGDIFEAFELKTFYVNAQSKHVLSQIISMRNI
jgi:hypothetical protein